MNFFSSLSRFRILPALIIDDAEIAADVASALKAGGLPLAEVTLRTPAAAAAMKAIAADSDIILGAGTVLTPDQVDLAVDCGASYVVAPGLNAKVVERCQHHQIPILPGACTPTEFEAALDLGISSVKFFPASDMGGALALKAYASPYSQMRFVPTGGVSSENMNEYLSLPNVIAVGGSWMCSPDLMRKRDFDAITRLTYNAVSKAQSAKGFSV
jgi:2-dehydro-3-deoxyphosphogluconate aldolase/(4S)-4-hydroxy-2-oxoglutarate aldolase